MNQIPRSTEPGLLIETTDSTQENKQTRTEVPSLLWRDTVNMVSKETL